INKRVGDVRRELRHEFTRQLENAFAPVGNEHESNQPDSNQSDSNQSDSNEGLQAEKNTRTLINKRLRSERGRLRSEFYRKLGIIEERVGEQRVQMSETLGSEQVKMLIGLSQQVQTYQTEIQLRQSEATSTIKQVAQEVYDSANDMLQATDAARSDIMINAQRIIAQVGRYEVDIATHSREIDSIGAELAGLHDATDPQQMARNTLRILGEHLLRITNS
ncbi:MAG TPA: hypothetical protein VMV29_11765, partial [Ktedonobacterales bacterium]|nr:hypothetical protein [Ktedonobacterales bacterium]